MMRKFEMGPIAPPDGPYCSRKWALLLRPMGLIPPGNGPQCQTVLAPLLRRMPLRNQIAAQTILISPGDASFCSPPIGPRNCHQLAQVCTSIPPDWPHSYMRQRGRKSETFFCQMGHFMVQKGCNFWDNMLTSKNSPTTNGQEDPIWANRG